MTEMRRTTVDSGYAWLRLAASLALTTGVGGVVIGRWGIRRIKTFES